MTEQYSDYSQVKERLDSIVDKVTDESISLDEALDLYDEAVKLASKASDLIEIDTSQDSDDRQDEGENQSADKVSAEDLGADKDSGKDSSADEHQGAEDSNQVTN